MLLCAVAGSQPTACVQLSQKRVGCVPAKLENTAVYSSTGDALVQWESLQGSVNIGGVQQPRLVLLVLIHQVC